MKLAANPFQTYSVVASVGDTAHHLAHGYRDSVVAAATLAERFGYTGCLLHNNFHNVDPWSLAPLILDSTERLVPLVATSATAAPPHTLARQISTMAAVYRRRVAVNVVTGADPTELTGIGDRLDHDQRYRRSEAHIRCTTELMAGDHPVSDRAEFWTYDRLALTPSVPPELRPEIFVAGSSSAAREAAGRIADVMVTHGTDPASPEMKDFINAVPGKALGVRLGVLARPDAFDALAAAQQRFPPERRAELATLRKLRSESSWVRAMATEAESGTDSSSRMSYQGFLSGKSHSAYVIGDYDEAAALLAEYHELGITRLLLDGPYDEEEFHHVDEVLRRVGALVSGGTGD